MNLKLERITDYVVSALQNNLVNFLSYTTNIPTKKKSKFYIPHIFIKNNPRLKNGIAIASPS
jgi:hypothetical protein